MPNDHKDSAETTSPVTDSLPQSIDKEHLTWHGERRHLYEVEAVLLRLLHRILGGHHPELTTIRPDHANLGYADAVVNPLLRFPPASRVKSSKCHMSKKFLLRVTWVIGTKRRRAPVRTYWVRI